MGKLDLDKLLASGFKPMTNEQQSRKWYQKKRLILPALVLFPPLGISLVWLSTWTRNGKIGATVFSGLFLIMALTSPPPKTQTTKLDSSNSSPVASLESSSKPKLTLAAYNQVKAGMTYEEVTKILGSGKEISRTEISGLPTTVMYQWEKYSGFKNMNAMFQDGKLVSKAQFGLD